MAVAWERVRDRRWQSSSAEYRNLLLKWGKKAALDTAVVIAHYSFGLWNQFDRPEKDRV